MLSDKRRYSKFYYSFSSKKISITAYISYLIIKWFVIFYLIVLAHNFHNTKLDNIGDFSN